jgi:hypothetical protein
VIQYNDNIMIIIKGSAYPEGTVEIIPTKNAPHQSNMHDCMNTIITQINPKVKP